MNKSLELLNEEKRTKTSNELAVQREIDVQLCDVMLEETASSTPRLLCKKGEWFMNGEKIPLGKEFIAFPMDAMRGYCRWEEDRVVEQRIGRIADKFVLRREDLPEDEDWKPQYALLLEDPDTGEIVMFVSCATGAKIAMEKLIQATVRAAKKGTGDLTPLVRLSTGTFPSPDFGTVVRPAFEIVPPQSIKTEMSDDIPY